MLPVRYVNALGFKRLALIACQRSVLPSNYKRYQVQLFSSDASKMDYAMSGHSHKVMETLSDCRRHFDYAGFVKKRQEGPHLLIDVRQPEEITETGAIPDSINIPLNDVEEALGPMTPEAFRMKYGIDKPSKGTLLIFSCRSGRRSVNALAKALSIGYLNSANYKGGWLEWEKQTKQE